jgi:hypothetical protein
MIGTTGSVNKKGEFDLPQYHAILMRHDVRAEMCGWIRNELYKSGFCPALQAVIGALPAQNRQSDAAA